MEKKVLVLGGGLLQIPLLRKAKEKGHKVYLGDYYANPPGKKYCDEAKQISTFSIEENYRYAKEEKINYVLTIGSDQPVYTAAKVSEMLNLPHPISAQQGKAFTNKSLMKKIMVQNNLPTPKFKIISSVQDLDFAGLNWPVVIKPVDSQGQRGIHVLKNDQNFDEFKTLFMDAQAYSLSKTVILEEFYEGAEITVNCWVKNGQANILLVTDRLHYDDEIVLGVCKQQRYPCQAQLGYEEEIATSVQALVDAFAIQDGPLYIQMIVGKAGPKFVEFGFRIGGGFESEIIPLVTGVDILELYFNLVTTGVNEFDPAEVKQNFKLGSIFFLFNKPGLVKKVKLPTGFEKHGKLYITEGSELGDITNATSRIGYFLYYTNNSEDYFSFINRFDRELRVTAENNQELLIHGLWE